MTRAAEALCGSSVPSNARPSLVRRRSALGAGELLAGLAFLTVALVWGSTYFAIAVAVKSFTPYGMVATRFALASALVLLVGRLRGEAWPERRDIPHLMLVGTLLLGVSNALVIWAEERVPSGLTAVLCALTPAWFGLFSYRRSPLGRRGWAGTALGLAGVGILAAPWSRTGLPPAGVAALLVSCAVWAFGTLHGSRHVASGGILTNVGLEMATACGIGLLAAPFTGGFLRGTPSVEALGAVAYLAVFGSCLAYTAHSYLAKRWNPVRLGTYAYLNPLIAVLLGCVLLGEPFGLRTATGIVVILTGVALVQLRSASSGREQELQEPSRQ